MEHKLSKNAAFIFKKLKGGDEPKIAVEQAYVVAYQKGYSTVEIARLAGIKSAKYIHASLVKNGAISSGKPGRQPKGSIPTKMRIHLTTRGLTFSQWCAGWQFDQVEVKKEVDERSGAAMAAIKCDFPGYYKLLTGVVVDDYVKPVKFEKHTYSVTINWDLSESCYRAEIMPVGAVGYGPSLQEALKGAQVGIWIADICQRLVDLPDKRELERELIW